MLSTYQMNYKVCSSEDMVLFMALKEVWRLQVSVLPPFLSFFSCSSWLTV